MATCACKCKCECGELLPLCGWVYFLHYEGHYDTDGTDGTDGSLKIEVDLNTPERLEQFRPLYGGFEPIFCFEPLEVAQHIRDIFTVVGTNFAEVAHVHRMVMRQRDSTTMRVNLGMVRFGLSRVD
eukprot:3270982-Rhodomonas_salina.1